MTNQDLDALFPVHTLPGTQRKMRVAFHLPAGFIVPQLTMGYLTSPTVNRDGTEQQGTQRRLQFGGIGGLFELL